jgi:hypothetical protein
MQNMGDFASFMKWSCGKYTTPQKQFSTLQSLARALSIEISGQMEH